MCLVSNLQMQCHSIIIKLAATFLCEGPVLSDTVNVFRAASSKETVELLIPIS